MTAHTPAELHTCFAEAMNRGDIEAMLGLYEPDATFLTGPDSPVQGLDAIREAFSGFLAMQPTIELKTISVWEGGGDLVMLQGGWTLTGVGPEASTVVMTGLSSEVARKQSDGRWLYVIDNPGTLP